MKKESELYYLKKEITTYQNGNNQIVFLLKKNVLKIENTKNNRNYIDKLIEKGIEKDESELFKLLFFNNFLRQKESSLDRNQLFVEYMVDKRFNNLCLKKKILVLGLGGLGGNIVFLLAQFGFEDITILDYDKVEKSDIYKHKIFKTNDLNKKKGDVLKELILKEFQIKINYIDKKINNNDNFNFIINEDKPDFIIFGIDPKPSLKIDFNNFCFKNNIPFIFGSYSYENIIVGPICVPNITSCFNSINELINTEDDVSENYLNTKRIYENYFIHPSATFISQIGSSMLFKEVLFFLLEEFDFCQAIGRIYQFNSVTFNVSYFNIKCKNCKVCGY